MRGKLNFYFLSFFWQCGLGDILKYDSLVTYFIMYKLKKDINILINNKYLLSLTGSWYNTAKILINELGKRSNNREILKFQDLKNWTSKDETKEAYLEKF